MCRVVLSVLLAAAALLACILRQDAFLLGMADSVFHVEEHRCWLMAELGRAEGLLREVGVGQGIAVPVHAEEGCDEIGKRGVGCAFIVLGA